MASRSGTPREPRFSNNDIRFGRDGIFVIASKSNLFKGNRFRDLRFAVHYMYTDDSEVSDNISIGQYRRLRHHVLPSSGGEGQCFRRRPRPRPACSTLPTAPRSRGNVVRGRLQSADALVAVRACAAGNAREHGLPARRQRSVTRREGARIGPEKCVFIYNANKNKFHDNRFEGCEIGVHFTAGSEGNEITGNAFVNNRNQVKYVGSRFLDWSEERPRQLLERQSRLRSQWRRHR